jgi:hypothetical protein
MTIASPVVHGQELNHRRTGAKNDQLQPPEVERVTSGTAGIRLQCLVFQAWAGVLWAAVAMIS